VALVTGAARGLGRAISLALANAGADVALGLRDVKADSGLAAEILKMGRRALPLQMDMRRMEQIFSAVDRTARSSGDRYPSEQCGDRAGKSGRGCTRERL